MSDRKPLVSNERLKELCMVPNACGPEFPDHVHSGALMGARRTMREVEALITKGELIPKAEVEAMLSKALGVPVERVWAELGTKVGFGTKIK